MEHPPKRQRLSRAARNGGAIGTNSKGNGGSIESHMANTDDDEAMEHGEHQFGGPHAPSLIPLRQRRRHMAKVVSVDQTEETGTRHWELHRRFAQDLPLTITEVVSVSVVVDETGTTQEATTSSTVSSSSSSSETSPQLPTVPSVPAFPTFTLPTVPAYPFTSTSTPAASPTSSSGFSPFGNSTSTGFGCNCTTTTFSNSTAATYTTLLNSTSTSSTYVTSSTEDSTTSSTETGFSSSTASSGGNWGDGGPATSTGASSTPTSGAGSSPGTDLKSSAPAVIGGVIGGIAGIALILILMLLFIRSRREQLRRRDLEPASDPTSTVSGPRLGLAGFLKRFRPAPLGVEASGTTSPGERGFYKVSGRKIPPVLGGGGGDGFGGGYDKETHGSLDDPHGAGPSGDRGVIGSSGGMVAIRPSPARTPMVSHSPTRESSHGRPPRPFRDGLGRSHPSEDGSKASKFVEDV